MTLIVQRGFLRKDNKELISEVCGIGYLMSVLVTVIEPVTITYLVWRHWEKLSFVNSLAICSLQILFTFAKMKVCSRVGRADGSTRREAVTDTK